VTKLLQRHVTDRPTKLVKLLALKTIQLWSNLISHNVP